MRSYSRRASQEPSAEMTDVRDGTDRSQEQFATSPSALKPSGAARVLPQQATTIMTLSEKEDGMELAAIGSEGEMPQTTEMK